MVKFTASLLVAALFAAPTTFAAVISDATFESRSLEDDLVARHIQEIWARFPHEEISQVVRELQEFEERSKVATFESRSLLESEHDLDARDIQQLWGQFPREEISGIEMREVQELEKRKIHIHISQKVKNAFHKIGKIFKKVIHAVSSVFMRREDGDEEIMARDFEAVDARDLEEFFDRYIEDLEERSTIEARDLEEFFDRYFRELEERSKPEPREFFDDEEVLERDLGVYDELD